MPRYTQEDEKIAHSEFGVVKDEEYLLRIIYAPEHIRDDLVIESAIALDDLSTRGFSLDRDAYKNDSAIQQRISTQSDKQPDQRQTYFIAKFQCISVRDMLDEANKRAFIVIDDVHDDNKAHASLYSAKANLGKGILRKLRSQLLPLLQK
ncbi:hypothetical protein [Crenothrix sp.]|uniref:hypothetical protein n=1 Tax=Crenothrix sp. TaxID=3100433 RepID=UPI00374D7CC0